MASPPKNPNRDNESKRQSERKKSGVNHAKKGNRDGNKMFTFKIVANSGDPGLSENEHFDILSRFLICELESGNRVPTNMQSGSLYYLVKRPEHLWINCEKVGSEPNYEQTRRKDYSGNITVGKAGYPSIKTIPMIDRPYTVGEIISAKKMPRMEIPETSAIFTSAFNSSWGGGDFASIYSSGKDKIIGLPDDRSKYTQEYWTHYGPASSVSVAPGRIYDPENPHRQIAQNNPGDVIKQLKPLYPASNSYRSPITSTEASAGVKRTFDFGLSASSFWFILHYYLVHYSLGICNPDNASTIESLKAGTQKYQGRSGLTDFEGRDYPPLINQKGGFLGQNILFSNVAFEDVNMDDKQRVETNECMPLIIASPNQFPTPKYRMSGAIIYNPTYAVIASAQGGAGFVFGGQKTIKVKVQILDNGVAFGGTSWTGAPNGTGGTSGINVQDQINKLDALFIGNSPSANINFQLDEIVTHSVGYGSTINQSDNSFKDVYPAIDPEHYFNIWMIPCMTGSCGSWATFPTSHGSSHDGIVVASHNLVGGGTQDNYSDGHMGLAHEAGHYFGLYHIWGDGDCSQDDGIDDTPNQDGPVDHCPDPAPDSCEPGVKVLTNNYMNYTNDACTNNFTQQQVYRMQATIETVRQSLSE
jgi:hypothetical protein